MQILAVGGRIFTSDPRFASSHSEDEGRYTLVISKVRPQDEGTYECQISTKPTKSLFIHLIITSKKIHPLKLIPSPTFIYLHDI